MVTVARRGTLLLLGAALIAAGVLLLVLPGPGLLVIAVGFAVLAREFRWAERIRDRLRRRAWTAIRRAQAARRA